MPRVFISHSTQDRAFVEQEIVALLERCGVETWYSKDSIQPTDQWERSILQGLKSCDVFLLVMSPRSAQSPWVKREVDWVFIKGGRRIIPVLMEECDPDDFHFGIGGIQHLDFSKDRALGREALARLWGKTERPASEGPRSPSSETISIASGGKIGDVIEVPLDSSLKMKLAWVPPGTSWLGGGGGTAGQDKFTLPKSLGRVYPVTQAEWQAVMGDNPSHFKNKPRHPVESVSWDRVQEFLKALNAKLSNTGLSYRLPTEQEWEYICRGGPLSSPDQSKYHFYFAKSKTDPAAAPTDDLSSRQANFDGNYPVGAASKGPLPGSDERGGIVLAEPSGNLRRSWQRLGVDFLPGRLGSGVPRRGWCYNGECCRAAGRGWYEPAYAFSYLGFRLLAVPVG